jgi:hypothetical protein
LGTRAEPPPARLRPRPSARGPPAAQGLRPDPPDLPPAVAERPGSVAAARAGFDRLRPVVDWLRE